MTDAATAAGAAGAAASPDLAAAGAAAGAVTPDPKPAAASGGAAPAGQAPADAGASAVYRPEGLPDHFLGKDERETIDKLFKAVDGYRKGDAARGEKIGAVPDAPEKYAFTPAAEVAAYLPNVADDPVLKIAQAAAHKFELGGKQFSGFINEFMQGLVTGGQLDDPFSAEKERAIVAGDVADPQERAKVAGKVANDTIAYIDALQQQGKIDQATADWAKGRTDRGHFLKLMQTMRSTAPTLEVGGAAAGGQSIDKILDARIADPRSKWGSSTYDPAFVAETKRLAQQGIGDGEPGRA
jgi:hypothetical protein